MLLQQRVPWVQLGMGLLRQQETLLQQLTTH
jgi:hypothetical protein